MSNSDGAAKVWRVLESVSLADGPDSAESKAAAELVGTGIDSHELLGRAARHALVPAVADLLVAHDLLGVVPGQLRAHLRGALGWNVYRTEQAVAEARRIADAFDDAGVQVAFNKGVVFQQLLYQGRGTRVFSDIDLMIRPADKDATARLLADLGYQAAKQFDHRRGELVDLPRSEILMYGLYPDHLPHAHRLTGLPHLPYFMVDIAFNAAWYGSGWQLPMDGVMAELPHVPVAPAPDPTTVRLPALDARYGFLFIVLHLFREAWFERAILEGDVRLTQFADVLRFWRTQGVERADEIRELVAAHRLGSVLAWVAHHVDRVYGSDLTGEFGGLAEYADPDWFASAGGVDGGYLRWHGDMRRRLAADDAVELSPAAPPPFAAAARVTPGT